MAPKAKKEAPAPFKAEVKAKSLKAKKIINQVIKVNKRHIDWVEIHKTV